MASESNSKAELSSIPSNVSGDGKSFVAALKNYLSKYTKDTNNAIDDVVNNIGEGTVGQITNVSLVEEHETNALGNVNNIRVEYDATSVENFSYAQIWYKEGNANSNASWVRHGSTNSNIYRIKNVKTNQDYCVKVIACNSNAGYANFDESYTFTIHINGVSLICNTPTQFYWSNDDNKWHWPNYIDNGYTSFFELRLDQNAGVWNEMRLDSIEADKRECSVMPPVTSGTAYLYVRNVFGEYNTPATHSFSLSVPNNPSAPTLSATLDGVVITFSALPQGCSYYIVDVDGTLFEINTVQWTYFKFSGSISVKYKFANDVVSSEWSDTVSIDIKTVLADTQIPTVTLAKLSDAVQSSLALADKVPDIEDDISDIEDDVTDIVTTLGDYKTITNADGTTSKVFSKVNDNEEEISSVKVNLNVTDPSKSVYSSIKQTASDISSVVSTLGGYEGEGSNKTFSAIKQNADSITSVVETLGGYEGEGSNKTFSSIKQTKDSLETVVETLGGYEGEGENKTFSAIKQTQDSIANVVSTLKGEEGTTQYSAITQLDSAIQLKVSTETYTSDMANKVNTSDYTATEIASKINSSSITIDGENVVIDADKVTISGTYISDGNIKANAIKAAAIDSNAVTTDKIEAGAIDATKLKAGALTVVDWPKKAVTDADGNTSYVDIPEAELTEEQKASLGKVTIKNGTVSGSAIKANSIYGDQIASNAIEAKHIKAGEIVVGGTNGNVTITDGSITADKLNIKDNSRTGRVEISTNLIRVFDDDNVLRVQIGIWE